MDDLASVWCEWAEMELQHKQFRRALDLMRRATATPLQMDRRKVRLAESVKIKDTVPHRASFRTAMPVVF